MKGEAWTKDLGARVQRIRKERRLTQEELADKAGLSVIHLRSIEAGRSSPSFVIMAKLARVLQVSLDELAKGIKSDEESVNEDFENESNNEAFRRMFPMMLVGPLDMAAKRMLLDAYHKVREAQTRNG